MKLPSNEYMEGVREGANGVRLELALSPSTGWQLTVLNEAGNVVFLRLEQGINAGLTMINKVI